MIYTFENVDEMLGHLACNDLAGKNAYFAMPEKLRALLVPGCCYCTEYEPGWVLFGKILEPENDPEDTPIPEHLAFVRAYSTCCPEGELGSVYKCGMFPILEEDFEAAREAGWDPPTDAVRCWIVKRIQTSAEQLVPLLKGMTKVEP